MEYETEFYKLLKLAVTDDVALIRVLDKIMKLINNNSKDMRGIIDEDLKSELITYSVELIRNKKICNKDLHTPPSQIHAYCAYIADKRLKIAVM